jgi:hypothetical protein
LFEAKYRFLFGSQFHKFLRVTRYEHKKYLRENRIPDFQEFGSQQSNPYFLYLDAIDSALRCAHTSAAENVLLRFRTYIVIFSHSSAVTPSQGHGRVTVRTERLQLIILVRRATGFPRGTRGAQPPSQWCQLGRKGWRRPVRWHDRVPTRARDNRRAHRFGWLKWHPRDERPTVDEQCSGGETDSSDSRHRRRPRTVEQLRAGPVAVSVRRRAVLALARAIYI